MGTDRLLLELINGLDVRRDVVCLGLVVLEQFFRLVDNRLVLQHRTVVRKIDSGWLRRQRAVDSLGVSMALAECLKSCDGLCRVQIIGP